MLQKAAEAKRNAVAVNTPPIVATAPAALTAAKETESAEAWIKRILELKRQLKSREVDEELVSFRKRYPDYALPPELKPSR